MNSEVLKIKVDRLQFGISRMQEVSSGIKQGTFEGKSKKYGLDLKDTFDDFLKKSEAQLRLSQSFDLHQIPSAESRLADLQEQLQAVSETEAKKSEARERIQNLINMGLPETRVAQVKDRFFYEFEEPFDAPYNKPDETLQRPEPAQDSNLPVWLRGREGKPSSGKKFEDTPLFDNQLAALQAIFSEGATIESVIKPMGSMRNGQPFNRGTASRSIRTAIGKLRIRIEKGLANDDEEEIWKKMKTLARDNAKTTDVSRAGVQRLQEVLGLATAEPIPVLEEGDFQEDTEATEPTPPPTEDGSPQIEADVNPHKKELVRIAAVLGKLHNATLTFNNAKIEFHLPDDILKISEEIVREYLSSGVNGDHRTVKDLHADAISFLKNASQASPEDFEAILSSFEKPHREIVSWIIANKSFMFGILETGSRIEPVVAKRLEVDGVRTEILPTTSAPLHAYATHDKPVISRQPTVISISEAEFNRLQLDSNLYEHQNVTNPMQRAVDAFKTVTDDQITSRGLLQMEFLRSKFGINQADIARVCTNFRILGTDGTTRITDTTHRVEPVIGFIILFLHINGSQARSLGLADHVVLLEQIYDAFGLDRKTFLKSGDRPTQKRSRKRA